MTHYIRDIVILGFMARYEVIIILFSPFSKHKAERLPDVSWGAFTMQYESKREKIMAIYKRCSRCGRRLLVGNQCPCRRMRHKEYDRYNRDREAKKFYTGKEWERIREKALELDGGIDVYVYMTTGEILLADTVHHIIPLRDDKTLKTDVGNLMSLHHTTHSMIERLYRSDKRKVEKELSDMLREYRQHRGRGRLKSFQ